MVRLNLQGFWIDLLNPTFELKWKHPIQNSLNGSNSTYSTDITAPLTTNNRLAFDYKIFTESAKTNIYLYGVLYVNGTAMRVRAFVRNFASDGITFYLEQFLTGGTATLLKDLTTLDNLFLPEIQNKTKRDVLKRITDGSLYSLLFSENAMPSVPDIFSFVSVPYIDANGVSHGIPPDNTGRPAILATGLLAALADFYGLTLTNAPANYLVFSNQWKVRDSMLLECTLNSFAETIKLITSDIQYNLFANSIGEIISSAPFRANFVFSGLKYTDGSYASVDYIDIYLKNSSDVLQLVGSIPDMTYDVPVSFECDAIVDKGTYLFVTKARSYDAIVTVTGYVSATLIIDYEAFSSTVDYANFDLDGFYPCWQNLPKVTAKEIIETIALCAGKMVEYLDDSINFIDFADVFDFAGAIDVSDKLISWKTKSFTFLQSQNATVVYADGTVIANILVNDPTLPDTVNNVATINAIRIQQDNGVDRVTDKIVLTQTPDSHFEIIDELAKIYAPATNPRMFEADFIYFEDSKKPLLIRQLGGIFIAIESLITTANTITLQLLKIK